MSLICAPCYASQSCQYWFRCLSPLTDSPCFFFFSIDLWPHLAHRVPIERGAGGVPDGCSQCAKFEVENDLGLGVREAGLVNR